MTNRKEISKIFTRRTVLLGLGKLSLFSVLVGRFGYMQIISSPRYKNMAENNSIKIIIIPPIRGLLKDRYDKIIVDNKVTYTLILQSKFKDQAIDIIKQIEAILGFDTDISKIGIKKVFLSAGNNNHIVIQENLSWTEITKIEIQIDLQGVEILKNYKRRYVFAEDTSHITGYIAKPTLKEIQKSVIPNYQDFLIGKNGIEKQLNDTLLGRPGIKKIEVNATGKFVREVLYNPSLEGSSCNLSIDTKLQNIVAKALNDYSGSAVIMDVYTGEILAMHSSPSYDPNRFIGGVQNNYWNMLNNDANKPLINKCISAIYIPGSIFKIVTALSILESGIDPSRKVFCTGEHQFGNRKFRCWKQNGHGWVDLNNAIAKSCNIYFYTFGLYSGIDNILKIANDLGFNQKTNVELPFESKGFLPTNDWIKSHLKNKWNTGDTVNISIGQGYLSVTPLQLANALSKVATGYSVQPTLIMQQKRKKFKKLATSEYYLQLVREGLYDVFNNNLGTGYNKRIISDKFTIAGKTGTAQVVSQFKRNQKLLYPVRDHGLFAGYISENNIPKYSIAVVIEHGGWGSISALPIGVEIMNSYL
jgi:penicillin-binding protein 2